MSKSEAFESLKLGTITGHEVKTAFKKLELLGSTKKKNCEKSGKWEIWGMLESFRSGIVCGSVDMNCSDTCGAQLNELRNGRMSGDSSRLQVNLCEVC